MEKLEIERRFLLKNMPDASGMSESYIRQIYAEYISKDEMIILKESQINIGRIPLPKRTGIIRIRETDKDLIEVNFKWPSGMYRMEIESKVALTHELSQLIESDERKIEKMRYTTAFENHTLFYDIFKGRYDGIFIKEAEFSSISYARNYLPDSSDREIFPSHNLSNKDMYISSSDEIFTRIVKLFDI